MPVIDPLLFLFDALSSFHAEAQCSVRLDGLTISNTCVMWRSTRAVRVGNGLENKENARPWEEYESSSESDRVAAKLARKESLNIKLALRPDRQELINRYVPQHGLKTLLFVSKVEDVERRKSRRVQFGLTSIKNWNNTDSMSSILKLSLFE